MVGIYECQIADLEIPAENLSSPPEIVFHASHCSCFNSVRTEDVRKNRKHQRTAEWTR